MILLLNQRYVNMYDLDVLNSFNYVEISMMLWNDAWMKGFELIEVFESVL